VPYAGDIVWLHFDPQAVYEKAGHRPALVLRPASYNGKTGLMLCCPLTTQIKGYPFEVVIADQPASVALPDQVKSLDWQARKARLKGRISALELGQARANAIALLGAS